jgi:hypothetical protein
MYNQHLHSCITTIDKKESCLWSPHFLNAPNNLVLWGINVSQLNHLSAVLSSGSRPRPGPACTAMPGPSWEKVFVFWLAIVVPVFCPRGRLWKSGKSEIQRKKMTKSWKDETNPTPLWKKKSWLLRKLKEVAQQAFSIQWGIWQVTPRLLLKHSEKNCYRFLRIFPLDEHRGFRNHNVGKTK